MNNDYEHWWDDPRYKKACEKQTKAPLLASAWRMEEAAAYAYELVRRLSLCGSDISLEEKQVLSSLPKFTRLNPFVKGIIRGSLWASWRVRPVAYSVPGMVAVNDFENYNRPPGYAQAPFSFDLTATFDALRDLLKIWYSVERSKRGIQGKGKKEVIPFRVTWDRIPLLESAYGAEKNRRRERAIECAKKNLEPVMRAWKFAEERAKLRSKPRQVVDHHPPKCAIAGYDWPPVLWKKVNLARRLRPKREKDQGYK